MAWLSDLLVLTALAATVAAAETDGLRCYSGGGLAALVFGCILGTLLIATGVAILVWYLLNSRKEDAKAVSMESGVALTSHAYDNLQFRDENGIAAVDASTKGSSSVRVRENVVHPRNTSSTQQSEESPQKARRGSIGSVLDKLRQHKRAQVDARRSTESLRSLREHLEVTLKSRDLSGLGFTILGNMRDGIFVREILPRGAAVENGQIHVDDQILSVTVDFKKMVFEDALTILSYASPYEVRLELRRPEVVEGDLPKTVDALESGVHGGERLARLHPLYKSQSTEDLSQKPSPGHRSLSARSKSVSAASDKEPSSAAAASKGDVVALSALESISEAAEGEATVVVTCAEISPPPPPDRMALTPSQSADAPAPGADPYAELSAEERMQVLRLSYEDPALTQSTPNLHAIAELARTASLDVASSPRLRLRRTDDAAQPPHADDDSGDSLPDIQQSMARLELAKADAQLSPAALDASLPSLNSTDVSIETETVVSVRSVAKEPTASPPALYKQQKRQLKPAFEQSNVLRPVETRADEQDERTYLAAAVSAPVAADDAGNLVTALGADSTQLDRDQYAKLLYFQQQLSQQHEELKQMGVQLPTNIPVGDRLPL